MLYHGQKRIHTGTHSPSRPARQTIILWRQEIVQPGTSIQRASTNVKIFGAVSVILGLCSRPGQVSCGPIEEKDSREDTQDKPLRGKHQLR